jgi:hypothetical protein
MISFAAAARNLCRIDCGCRWYLDFSIIHGILLLFLQFVANENDSKCDKGAMIVGRNCAAWIRLPPAV